MKLNIRFMLKLVLAIFLSMNWFSAARAQTSNDSLSLDKEVYFSLKNEWLLHRLDSTLVVEDTFGIFQTLLFFEQNELWKPGVVFLQNIMMGAPERITFLSSDSIKDSIRPPEVKKSDPIFPFNSKWNSLTIGTGINYSENNFDILNLDQDSLIQERISSPVLDLSWRLGLQQWQIPITYGLDISYDKSFTSLNNRISFLPLNKSWPKIVFSSNRLISTDSTLYTYWENKVELSKNFKLGPINTDVYVYIKNKSYDHQSETIKNYNNILMSLYFAKPDSFNFTRHSLYMEYYLNQKISFPDFEKYGYVQYTFSKTWHKVQLELIPGYLFSQYKYDLIDSTVANSYHDFILNQQSTFHITNVFYIEWNMETFLRQYKQESDYENNVLYAKNKIGPGKKFGNHNSITLFYIDEYENHFSAADSFNIDDFHSKGVGINLNLSSRMMTLLVEYEYLHKNTRAPFSEIISYNQPSNGHNVLFSLFWRISPRWKITGNISYNHERNIREKNFTSYNYINFMLSYTIF